MAQKYNTLPKPFTLGLPLYLPETERWGFSFTDAAGVEHCVTEFPCASDDQARRTARLLCATIGADPLIALMKSPAP